MTSKPTVKPFVREVPTTTWYLARRRDQIHMAQELTSLFIGIYALLLLCAIRAVAEGPAAYQSFLASLGSPLMLGLLWITFAVTLFHTVSWFGVTHKAMPLQVGEGFLPPVVIVGAHYAAWVVVSLFILFIAGVLHG